MISFTKCFIHHLKRALSCSFLSTFAFQMGW